MTPVSDSHLRVLELVAAGFATTAMLRAALGLNLEAVRQRLSLLAARGYLRHLPRGGAVLTALGRRYLAAYTATGGNHAPT